jgi:hypothetical protein
MSTADNLTLVEKDQIRKYGYTEAELKDMFSCRFWRCDAEEMVTGLISHAEELIRESAEDSAVDLESIEIACQMLNRAKWVFLNFISEYPEQ